MSGYIYFIAAETLGAVKIGFTRAHPDARLRALQTGCPSPLKLLDYVPGTEDEERRLHEAFAPLHIQGEWFQHELKLQDFLFYLDHEAGHPADRQSFENALHDILLIGSWYPDQPTPREVYDASGSALPFAELIGR